ncbi:NAD(P)-dependent dehydrogenase (short-subunit alcohol dehydrogenase family) [Jatrophihabitans sp. GAS493]|uniref:SDR family NAD(P)-dependent oxidoreductase n=1 Tax=Jatrophihabitans sp. GAS493 TaxID=1907575 RepID=UPI000BB7E336|nr:SDR family oxidoreductase [Jatrophihabitans sp. GAS493]SOD74677.1 NAD(P)-dependent dehydrogenase (short-subunit alcohol dehydrogenase family) [Jatrophihabitans sp. GAS493]
MQLGRRFEGRNVLVVGGGSEGSVGADAPMGNGRAIALRLAAEGARVAVSDRDLDRAQATVDALEESRGVALRADAGSIEESAALARAAAEAIGPLDVVICNVGITGSLPARTQTVEDWALINDVNVRSHWLVAQGALPAMLERGHGAFVFVTSIAGMICSGSSLSYEASKASLIAVSRHFGVRYAERGIRSNALSLGVIDSTMVRRDFGDDPVLSHRRDLMQPMRRQGRPEEAAAAAAFLASDDAAFITGQVLVVDGGRTADGSYERRYQARD